MSFGFVLSGGGSKCIAHLGMIQALEEMGIRPQMISGVSGGALLGSLYAAGMSPKEILNTINHRANFSFYFPSIRAGGIFSMGRLARVYQETLPVERFEELSIPLVINATDIRKGTSRYFDKGEIRTPVIASSSYPVVFEPVEIDNELYLDGGIVNNFPIEPLQGKCDKIIGLSVGRTDYMARIGSIKRIIFRSLELAIQQSDQQKFKDCDVLLAPEGLSDFNLFDFSEAEKIYKLGYIYGKQQERHISTRLSS